jgi:regulator of sigma E protease
MQLLGGVILGLIVLVFLVVIHELGHAIIAKRNGVVVEEFGIGFPPRAWSKKLKNGVLFTLNWLPLGGFVKLQGEYDSADQKGDYGAATFWQKTRILLAGVIINWLVAAILLTVLAVTGLPKILPNQFSISSDTVLVQKQVEIASLTKNLPAAQAGLQSGDALVRFAGQSIPSSDELVSLIKTYAGQTVEVIYNRDGVEATAKVTLRDGKSGAIFGAGFGQQELIKATWSAPIVGVATTGQLTWATLEGLGNVVGNLASGIVMQFSPDQATRTQAGANLKAVSNSVSGPIGILGSIFPQAERAGLTQFVFLSAVISLTLAVMNVLPIPALDGGRWFVMAIFRLTKKTLTKDLEEKIQVTGFLILMALVVLVTIADVTRLF